MNSPKHTPTTNPKQRTAILFDDLMVRVTSIILGASMALISLPANSAEKSTKGYYCPFPTKVFDSTVCISETLILEQAHQALFYKYYRQLDEGEEEYKINSYELLSQKRVSEEVYELTFRVYYTMRILDLEFDRQHDVPIQLNAKVEPKPKTPGYYFSSVGGWATAGCIAGGWVGALPGAGIGCLVGGGLGLVFSLIW